MKMKKILVFLLTMVMSFGLFLLYDNFSYDNAMVEAGLSYESKKEDISIYVPCEIVGLNDREIIVRPIIEIPIIKYSLSSFGAYEYLVDTNDRIKFNLEGVKINCELEVGKTVQIPIVYSPDRKLNDYIKGKDFIQLPIVEKIENLPNADIDMVDYKGRRYQKHNLSEETLNWLELSDEEKEKSEYYPWDLVENGYRDLLSNIEEWGITTKGHGATSTTIVIDVYQEDFIPTTLNDNWVYSIDSKFEIEKWNIEKQKWFKVETLYGDEEIPWDDGIEILELDSEIPYGYCINWGWLYSELPEGEYRIKKEIRVDKSEDDYSWRTIYIYFELK